MTLELKKHVQQLESREHKLGERMTARYDFLGDSHNGGTSLRRSGQRIEFTISGRVVREERSSKL